MWPEWARLLLGKLQKFTDRIWHRFRDVEFSRGIDFNFLLAHHVGCFIYVHTVSCRRIHVA